MSKRFAVVLPLVGCLAAGLSACGGGATQVNELRFNQHADGTFSGSAGPAWSEAEIRAQACHGNGAATLVTSPSASGLDFHGRCGGAPVNSYGSAAAPVQSEAPAHSTAPGGWDGSTPFVD